MHFEFDKRMLYVAIAIMILWGFKDILSNTGDLLALLYSLPGILIAITFHEFAHAIVADKLGDDTPRREGRITLNPLAHIDPIGFIMLIFAKFGWGKPVHVNPNNYNRDMSMEKADCLVSIAGPAMNFILVIFFTLIYCMMHKFLPFIYSNTILSILDGMIQSTIVINIGLGVFNLIPLPPLDGSKVIKPFLPKDIKYWFEDNEKIFYIIFIILWVTGIAGGIITPIIEKIYNLVFEFGMIIFRI